jgi:hypothetical protein
MRDYSTVSYWLETSGDDLTPRPALDGSTQADVAILGAGYTGLWTAYYLLRHDPSLRVVLVEREIAGFGASGRNGAWCAPGLNISLGRLERLHGRSAARRTSAAVADAVDEVGRVAASEGIDIEWRGGGGRGGEGRGAGGPAAGGGPGAGPPPGGAGRARPAAGGGRTGGGGRRPPSARRPRSPCSAT